MNEAMNAKLKEFISSLKQTTVNQQHQDELKDLISDIQQLKTASDNELSTIVISILTVMPEIMQDPSNQAIKHFCEKLETTELSLSKFIHEQFYGSPLSNPKLASNKRRLSP
jgi:hypothetical protein